MSYLSEILSDSPVGVWFLDEASGTSAADQSGNSRSGTYTGSNTKRAAKLVVSEQNAVDLTGGYIDLADINAWSPVIANTGTMTVECWFVADTLSAAEMLIAKHLEYNIRLEANGSVTWFVVNSGGGAYMETDSAAAAITTGTLYHLVGVFNGSTPKIETFKNGVSINSSTTTTGSGVSGNTGNALHIGHRSDNGGSVFDGRIGFVAIYPTALSSARILAHYNAGLAVLPNAVMGVGTVQQPPVVITPSNVSGTGTVFTPPTLLALDSFNRADSATSLGTADVGGTWSHTSTRFGIQSNAAYLPIPAGGTSATLDVGVSNHATSVKVNSLSNGFLEIIGRYSDSSNMYQTVLSQSGTLYLQKVVSGTGTVLGTSATNWVAGRRYGIICAGANIALTENGVPLVMVTDTSLASGTLTGLRVDTQSGTAAWSADDFIVQSGAGPTLIATALPSSTQGVGTVQTPVKAEVASPSNVAGTGTVQTPSIFAGIRAVPSVISGVGTVQTPAGVFVARPTTVFGVGTVRFAIVHAITPADPETLRSVGSHPIRIFPDNDGDPFPPPTVPVLEFVGRQTLLHSFPVPGGDLDGFNEVFDYPHARIIPIGVNEFWVAYWQQYDFAGGTGRATLYMEKGVYDPDTLTFTTSGPLAILGGQKGANALPPMAAGGDTNAQWGFVDALCIIPLDSDRFLLRFYDYDGGWDSNTYGTGSFDQTIGCVLVTMNFDATPHVTYGDWQVIYNGGGSAFERTATGSDDRMIRLGDGRVANAYTNTNRSVVVQIGDIDLTTGDVTWGTEWVGGTGIPWTQSYDDMKIFEVVGETETTITVWWVNDNSPAIDHSAVVALFTIDSDNNLTLVDWSYIDVPLNGNARYYTDFLYFYPSTITSPRPGFFWAATDYKHSVGTANWFVDILTFDISQFDGTHQTFFVQPFADYAYVNPIYEGFGGRPFRYPGWSTVEMTHLSDGSAVFLWDDRNDFVLPSKATTPWYWQRIKTAPNGVGTLVESGVFGGVPGLDTIPANDQTDYTGYPVSVFTSVPTTGGEILVGAMVEDTNDDTDPLASVRVTDFNLVWFFLPSSTGSSSFPGESLYPGESLFPGES